MLYYCTSNYIILYLYWYLCEKGIYLTKKQYLILLALGFGGLLSALNTTMFNVALPIMMEVFNASLSSVQWLTSGYMLAAGIIVPAAAFLGERFGYKRVFCIALMGIFGVSIFGAFAWCIEVLIVARFIFGFTGGLLSPLSLAMLYRYMPSSQQTLAASVWSMTAMVGAVLSTCLSGFILSIASWRFLLLFNVPFALIAVLLCIKVLPSDQTGNTVRMDGPGFVQTSIASFMLLFAFSNLSNWGMSVKLTVCIVVGLIFLLLYYLHSRKTETPLLNLAVLKYKRYCAAFISSGVNVIAIYMVAFLMPLFLQIGMGVSPAVTGLVMLPGSIVSIIAMPIAAKLYAKIGEKLVAVMGVVTIFVGSIPFILATPETPILLLTSVQCVRCFGLAMVNLVSTNAQMSAVPPELSGHASALTNWSHQMLNALTVALAGSIAELRVAHISGAEGGNLALAYTSTTNLMMLASCVLLMLMIPIALKFYRNKNEC